MGGNPPAPLKRGSQVNGSKGDALKPLREGYRAKGVGNKGMFSRRKFLLLLSFQSEDAPPRLPCKGMVGELLNEVKLRGLIAKQSVTEGVFF